MDIKKYTFITLSSFVLSACGGGSDSGADNNKNQSQPTNRTKSQLTLAYLNDKTPLFADFSTDINSDTPAYNYGQVLNFKSPLSSKTYTFTYNFTANDLTYMIEAEYLNLNSQPISVNIYEKNCNNDRCLYSRSFTCKPTVFVCNNTAITVDQNTGASTLTFNHTKIVNLDDYKQLNYLDGSITGSLAQKPQDVPDIFPTGMQYEMKINGENIQYILAITPIKHSHYEKIRLINHNIIEFWTNIATEGDSIHIRIKDNKPILGILSFNSIYDIIFGYDTELGIYPNIMNDKIIYNPKNYEITFNGAEVEWVNLHMTLSGTIGP
ncbi:hypothetical protein RFI36_00135 [Acinetobacter gerneri]|uniref:Lipoprotein n=2 Tax=Acinetobacter gerneri TaxID=202952 RepID=A0AAW8JCY7_9GAMM|nr:hypothetical protein [Acinetobacter gerneri]MDQ9008154.1 hypothetical protein [Acinetobacter gerneri]MDQ9012432.1 hypothetical protein [Acinetobacter gerneri]MDQ9023693.1 hypothetical protein [Acinetobacter gerneri]MDQ9051345.1 hypothetical protein [Acinetobacter gerneri]MDQ9058796.1 hypothetical protein [Acinetobacter gerneri]